MKVMSTEIGIEIAATRVDRIENRNRKMTMTAKKRPSRPSVASELIDCWMNGAWSNTTVNWVLPPTAAARSSSCSLTAFETSTVLPAGRLRDGDRQRRVRR